MNRIKVRRERLDPVEKLNLAAIRSEVQRFSKKQNKRIESLEKQNAQYQVTISKLDKVIHDMANTVMLAASSKNSTRATVQELITGLLSDLTSRNESPRDVGVAFVQQQRRDGMNPIGRLVSPGVSFNNIDDTDDGDDPIDDIIANVSED